LRDVRRPRLHAAVFVCLLACACRAQKEVATQRDDLGRSVAIPRNVTRVVSLAANVTEMIYAAGAEAKLVGTDDFSNYPPAALSLPKVGGMQPNVERIVALRPDLVFASSEGNMPNIEPPLNAAGIPIYVVRTDRLAEIAPAIERVGALLGAELRAVAASQVQLHVAAQRRMRATHPRVLFAVWADPLYVAGRATFTDDLFALTGAQNAVQITGWPQYSLESLAEHPPDIVLYPLGSVTRKQIDALLARAPGVHPRVVAVDEDIFQRPGPRVAEAAQELNAILDAER
jgi:iron complex transport system substrate-binding protein